MKIGILTYHRAENYGALLQAYATKAYLQGLGHVVSFVDYWPKYHSDYFRIFPYEKFKKGNIRVKLGLLRRETLWSIFRIIRKKRLQGFMKERLGLSSQPQYTQQEGTTSVFDTVIYGSDQIWRKQHLGGVEYDSWYFGSNNVQAKRKIVYAGSMGAIATTAEDDNFIRTAMKNFDSVSVREADLQTYLAGLGITSVLVSDPVFLLSKAQWRSIVKPTKEQGKYILFYNLLGTEDSTKFAEALSRKTGMPIREINKKFCRRHLGRRYIGTASVERFLGLIDGAAYVVSNSFHGVAFSIIFEKQFFAVGMKERANRVVSLLSSAGILERYISQPMTNDMICNPIDYERIGSNLQEMVSFSKQYLRESIVL